MIFYFRPECLITKISSARLGNFTLMSSKYCLLSWTIKKCHWLSRLLRRDRLEANSESVVTQRSLFPQRVINNLMYSTGTPSSPSGRSSTHFRKLPMPRPTQKVRTFDFLAESVVHHGEWYRPCCVNITCQMHPLLDLPWLQMTCQRQRCLSVRLTHLSSLNSSRTAGVGGK